MTATPKLNAALAKVQAKLPKLERDRTVEVTTNKGSYSYSYATLSNLTEAVLPLLAEHGLAFAAMPGLGEAGKMCLRYSLLHESGEALTGEFPLAGEGGIQMLGGRITYARRYCLAAVVGIAADEDDESRLADDGPRPAQRSQRQAAQQQRGTTTQRSTPPPAAARPPLPGESAPDSVTGPQLTKVNTVLGQIGWNDRDDKLRAASAIVGRPLQSSKDMTKAEAHALIEALEKVAAGPDPADKLGELVAEARGQEGEQGNGAEGGDR
jgi:hypothetical protein